MLENSGYFFNGFINHYPDFIALSKTGKIFLIEAKGEQLKTEDSEAKVRLGKAWDNMAGSQYKYFMVFDNDPLEMEGAYNFADFCQLIKEM